MLGAHNLSGFLAHKLSALGRLYESSLGQAAGLLSVRVLLAQVLCGILLALMIAGAARNQRRNPDNHGWSCGVYNHIRSANAS